MLCENKMHSPFLTSASTLYIEERRAKGCRLGTPFVVCTFLEQNSITSGVSCMQTFRDKGGNFVTLNPFSSKPTTFEVKRNDRIFISCSAGFRRSQTLWVLLLPYADKGVIHLSPPHATRYGCDPYNGEVNWHENDEEENKPGDEFELWSGFPKSQRLGFEKLDEWKAKLNASPKESVLSEITQYYNDHYYAPPYESLDEGRRIYITFAANTHVHFHRLNESNQILTNVTVVHLDLDDLITKPLEEWNTDRASFKAYQNFAELLKQVIDCSQLF